MRTNLGYHFDGSAHPTLARTLRKHGYATGAAVSSYVLRGATGIDDSWDLFDDAVGGDVAWTRDVSLLKRPGGETARRALAWVEGVKAKPFFLFVHLFEPHLPYEPPEPFRTRYGATYDAEIAAADAVVGELVGGLKRQGLYDRAIVLLVSDHGEGLGDHGEEEHGILLYREVLHVPLLMKLPGSREAGSRLEAPVALTDIVPTVASLLKLEGPPRKGASLLERGRGKAGSAGIYSETYYPRIHFGWSSLRSLVDERRHYIDGPKPELYDIARDPGEKTDAALADAGVAQAMKRALQGYPSDFVSPGRVDPELAERLKALGYVSESVPTRDDEGLPNPRDRVHVHEKLKHANRLVSRGQDRRGARRAAEPDRGGPRFLRSAAGPRGNARARGPIRGGRGRLQGGHAGLSPARRLRRAAARPGGARDGPARGSRGAGDRPRSRTTPAARTSSWRGWPWLAATSRRRRPRHASRWRILRPSPRARCSWRRRTWRGLSWRRPWP